MTEARTETAWASDLGELRRNLATMARVGHALVLREARTRYGQSDAGYLWAVVEPMIQLILLVGLFVALNRRIPAPASVSVFVATGILPYNFWRGCAQRGATAIASNVPLLTYPQVRPIDLVISRCVLDFCTYVVLVGLFVVGLHLVMGEPFSSWDKNPLGIIAAVAVLFFFSFAWAMFNSSFNRIVPSWDMMFAYMARPLWWTSGVFYTMDSVPQPLRTYLSYNPLAHIIEWLRSECFPGYHSNAYNIAYPIYFGLVLLFLALVIDWGVRLTGRDDYR